MIDLLWSLAQAHAERLLAMLLICVSDWGAAASHMAFDRQELKPFYRRRFALTGDVFHLVAGLRYVGLTAVAVYAFGPRVLWYPCTAIVCYVGWQALKALHNKDWPPIWRRWL